MAAPKQATEKHSTDGWGEVALYTLIPLALLGYGLWGMARGWDPKHAILGLVGYLAGCGVILWRMNR